MEHSKNIKYTVGILVISDTVFKQEKEDRSGINLEKILNEEKYFCISQIIKDCVADDKNDIERILKNWCADRNIDLILTVGGTGFSSRDVTPEATKSVIEKEASHLSTYMIMRCCEKTKFAALSRSVCGIRDSTLILNLPGSSKGSQECFEVIAPLLPHAMDQLKGLHTLRYPDSRPDMTYESYRIVQYLAKLWAGAAKFFQKHCVYWKVIPLVALFTYYIFWHVLADVTPVLWNQLLKDYLLIMALPLHLIVFWKPISDMYEYCLYERRNRQRNAEKDVQLSIWEETRYYPFVDKKTLKPCRFGSDSDGILEELKKYVAADNEAD